MKYQFCGICGYVLRFNTDKLKSNKSFADKSSLALSIIFELVHI